MSLVLSLFGFNNFDLTCGIVFSHFLAVKGVPKGRMTLVWSRGFLCIVHGLVSLALCGGDLIEHDWFFGWRPVGAARGAIGIGNNDVGHGNRVVGLLGYWVIWI